MKYLSLFSTVASCDSRKGPNKRRLDTKILYRLMGRCSREPLPLEGRYPVARQEPWAFVKTLGVGVMISFNSIDVVSAVQYAERLLNITALE